MAELVELIGPGGKCKVPAKDKEKYLARDGWKEAPPSKEAPKDKEPEKKEEPAPEPEDEDGDEDEDLEDDDDAPVELEELAKPILVEKCRELGLPVKGTKAELARRIRLATGEGDEVDEFLES